MVFERGRRQQMEIEMAMTPPPTSFALLTPLSLRKHGCSPAWLADPAVLAGHWSLGADAFVMEEENPPLGVGRRALPVHPIRKEQREVFSPVIRLSGPLPGLN